MERDTARNRTAVRKIEMPRSSWPLERRGGTDSIAEPTVSQLAGPQTSEPSNAHDNRESTRWAQMIMRDDSSGDNKHEQAGCRHESHMSPLDSDLCNCLEVSGVARIVGATRRCY